MPRKKNWGEPTRSSERLKEKDQRQAEERRRPKALDLSKPTEKNASEKEATIPISPPPDAPQRTDPYGGIAGLIKAFDQNSKIPPKQVAIVKRSLSGGSYNAPLEDPKKPKTGESPQEFGAERPQLDESRREGLSLPSEQGPHTTYQTIDINYNPGGGENLPMVSTHSARDILPSEASEQQHTEIERQRLKLLVNQTSELLQRSADFDFDMVIKISEVSEKTDKGNMSRQEIQDNYNEIKEHYLALGGDPTLLDERPFRAGSPVHPEQDHSLPMDLDDYDIDEGNDTGSQNSTRHGSPKIRYDAYVQSLRNERIPEVYGELRRKLEQASKLDNPNQELGEIIKEAQDLVDKHQTNFDALNELHDMHKENYKNLKDQYDLDLGELEELGLGEEQLKDQRKQLQQNFKEQTMDLKEKFQQSLELDYLGYTDQLEEYHDNLRKFTDPESDRPDSFHEQDSKPKATEVSKPEEVFSEDEVKCTFAVERAVTLGYFEYWRRDGIEQPDTEEFRKTYHSALELVGTDTEDLTSQNIGHLNKINKIFKECVKSDVEKDPQKFRLHLKQTLVDARNRIAWTDEFKEHFNIEENWVKDSIQKLGITSGNFDDGYIMLLTNESEISNDVVMSKKPMDEIIDSYQKSANADEIVSTYEKFMRGKVGLDSIHSQLRDGIPVDNRPSHIWNREVTFVSGEKNNCVPHSLLKGAHPEWSSDFIKLESEKAKNYVIKALKEKTRLYEEKVEEYMNEGSKHQEAKEQAANELEIFDVENLNIGSDDMLNPGGDTGRMLISYLRETKVTDPDSGKEVPLLDPDRPVLVYQLRNGRMSCTTKVEPNYEEQPYNASSSYAILRDHEALHYYAILPQEDS